MNAIKPTQADLQLWAHWASKYADIPKLTVSYSSSFTSKELDPDLEDADCMVVVKQDADCETALSEIAWATTVMQFNSGNHPLHSDFRTESRRTYYHVLFCAALGDDHGFDPQEKLDRAIAADILEECGSAWSEAMRKSSE
jgi:hypothetical protein